MITEKLSEEIWRTCVDSMPIFGIDMIIFSQTCGVLMGRRINNPAKGKLFVPGGRVYKNEARKDAFKRILKNETGLNIKYIETSTTNIMKWYKFTTKN